MPTTKQRIIQRPGTTIGMTPTRPDGRIATPSTPNAPAIQETLDRSTEIYTYITQVTLGTPPTIYNGDREWALVTLLLETAGPVAVSTRADLLPVTSGKGKLLITNEPYEITIAKGNRLYIAATAANRVAVKIEPVPWLEQITRTAQKLVK